MQKVKEPSIELLRSDEKCLIGFMRRVDPDTSIGKMIDNIKACIREAMPNKHPSCVKIYKAKDKASFNVALSETYCNVGKQTLFYITFLHEKMKGCSEKEVETFLEGIAENEYYEPAARLSMRLSENENG